MGSHRIVRFFLARAILRFDPLITTRRGCTMVLSFRAGAPLSPPNSFHYRHRTTNFPSSRVFILRKKAEVNNEIEAFPRRPCFYRAPRGRWPRRAAAEWPEEHSPARYDFREENNKRFHSACLGYLVPQFTQGLGTRLQSDSATPGSPD